MPLQTRPLASLLYPQPLPTPSSGGGTRRGCLQNPPTFGVSSARPGGPPPPPGAHLLCTRPCRAPCLGEDRRPRRARHGGTGPLRGGRGLARREQWGLGASRAGRTRGHSGQKGTGRPRLEGPRVSAVQGAPAGSLASKGGAGRGRRAADAQAGRDRFSAAHLSSLARRRGVGGWGVGEEPAGQGTRGPAQTSGVGGSRGGVQGSPRVRLSARAVWANSRPSWGVSISASSADSLLQSRSSASRLPVDTARGSARSWRRGGRSGLPPPTTGGQAHVVPRAPRSAPVNPQELRVLSHFGHVWLFATP